ncbi:hypothetical protein AtubIFM55763_005565 [Aspergillus tubingensis]|nr:hypothetical protein AtubIFM55763_005565 [Aspergillus tubingensis]
MVLSSKTQDATYYSLDSARVAEPGGSIAIRQAARLPSSMQTRVVAEGIRILVATTLALTLVPPGSTETVWSHNRTFAQRPTPESEEAWNSIIPDSTNKHAIVVSYHSAIEEANLAKGEGAAVANDGDPEDPHDDYIHHTGTRMTLSHIQHCFDYLRQTLMCAADTNLEVLDPVTHVTSGWGQPKQCRDYRSVVAWAEKWANSSDTGILT